MPRFPTSAPIRLILFDAFDTLVTPRSAPHLQYAAVAKQHGLRVSDNDVKSAFKHAFRATSVEHPNYGLDTDIASPDQWWELVIQRTFAPHLHSEVTRDQYKSSIASLSQRLVTRFGTEEAYHLFEDVVPSLERLTQIRSGDHAPVSMALATNSDSRILSVLKSFGLDRFLELDVSALSTTGPTLSYFEKCAKPDRSFFHAAFRRNQDTGMKLEAANVLYVGDQLYEDFWGATEAGLQAAWLQRSSTLETNQPYQKVTEARNSEQDQAYVRQRTIRSLSDLADIVTHSHT